MLTKPPALTTPAMQFAFAGFNTTVRLAHNVACPHCGRFLRASDVEVDRGGVSLLCSGCHTEILLIDDGAAL